MDGLTITGNSIAKPLPADGGNTSHSAVRLATSCTRFTALQ
jgi:hypothetical protein